MWADPPIFSKDGDMRKVKAALVGAALFLLMPHRIEVEESVSYEVVWRSCDRSYQVSLAQSLQRLAWCPGLNEYVR